MPGKNSPSKQRNFEKLKSCQYIKGASRALTVGLRVAGELKLTPDETITFLRGLRDQLYVMIEAGDVEPPILDRAVAATLAKCQGG